MKGYIMQEYTRDISDIVKPKLLENLGSKKPTPNSNYVKKFGIFECPFCGSHFEARLADIKSGNTKSCGCYQVWVAKSIGTHQHSMKKIYYIWGAMVQRITNPNNKDFSNYGGRGLTIFKDWVTDPALFIQWAKDKGYEEGKGLSLDRIDNNIGYFPDNCRWVDKYVQAQNQRRIKPNKTGYIGVTQKGKFSFVASITANGQSQRLGAFRTAIEASHAYDKFIIDNNLSHTLNFSEEYYSSGDFLKDIEKVPSNLELNRLEFKNTMESLENYDFSKYDWNLNYMEKSVVICSIHGEQLRSIQDLKRTGCCVKCNKLKIT